MRLFLVSAILCLSALPASSDEQEVFYGIWGTDKQCARAAIKDGGTVLAMPFEINESWLKHGEFYCQLTWFPIDTRENGYFSGAFARCGEDAVRDYTLGMILEDGELTLRWGLSLQNGPLLRCPVS